MSAARVYNLLSKNLQESELFAASKFGTIIHFFFPSKSIHRFFYLAG